MILVTGAAGFVGRHLVSRLVARGAAVRGLDLADWPAAPEGYTHLRGSILDRETCARALAGVDTVLHLAALTELWAAAPAAHAQINHAAALALAQDAKAAGARRFVYVSSLTTLIAGPRAAQTVTEDAPPPLAALLGAYPRSKRAGEEAVLALDAPGFAALSVIPTLPAGPGDVNRTAPTRLIKDLAAGGPPAILETWLDLVDARDLAETLVAAGERGRGGERYLVAGHGLFLSALAALVDKACGRIPRPRPRAPYALALLAAAIDTGLIAPLARRPPAAPLTGVRLARRLRRFDDGKARAELGHAPRPLEETLRDQLAWLAADGSA